MKLFFYCLALTFVVISCKPEWKVNKQLDGSWILTSIDGQPVETNYSETVTFSKKGSGGNVTTTAVLNNQTATTNGTYTLLKNSTVTFAYPNGNTNGYAYNTAVFDINEYSKTTLNLTNQKDGKVFIYTKN